MRKIEAQMIQAIRTLSERGGPNEQTWSNGNTCVRYVPIVGGAEIQVMLHGHLIAQRRIDCQSRKFDGWWQISLCGWDTRTTRSRLSVILRYFSQPYDHATRGEQFCARYPNGLGVSSRKTKAGQAIRIHDRRGITPITVDGWHNVQL